MMLKRNVAVFTGKGDVKMTSETLAELKDHEVRIKVHASLISPGTEIANIMALRAAPDAKAADRVFGYANAGEIVKVKGEVKGLKAGMRVAAMGTTGAHHATYANVPVNMVVPLPEGVTYDQAVYACLGATSLQAIRRTVPELGEYGLVLGLGIVGNLAAQLAQLSGARVIGWEGFDARIKLAKKCGIRSSVNFRMQDAKEETRKFVAPYGADFAIFAFGGEATAAFESVKACMKVSADTHVMGRIVLVGGCKINVGGGAHSGNLDIRAASRTGPGYKDLEYEYGKDYPAAFVQFTTQRNLREIIRLIAERRLVVDPMTTHRLPLHEVGKAVALLIEHPDKAMGIVLTMAH
jgi:threonine dehydrogenase-like Zn-dependent dehydrogenase